MDISFDVEGGDVPRVAEDEFDADTVILDDEDFEEPEEIAGIDAVLADYDWPDDFKFLDVMDIICGLDEAGDFWERMSTGRRYQYYEAMTDLEKLGVCTRYFGVEYSMRRIVSEYTGVEFCCQCLGCVLVFPRDGELIRHQDDDCQEEVFGRSWRSV